MNKNWLLVPAIAALAVLAEFYPHDPTTYATDRPENCVELQLTSSHYGTNSYYLNAIAVVTNTCGRMLSWVSYDGYLEDAAGVELDTALANTSNLAAGASKRIQFTFRNVEGAAQYSAELRRARF